MTWDIALSDGGDLIMSGHNDLLGKSGTDLLEQRMVIRLRVHRGDWVLDEMNTFGSDLYQLINMPPSRAQESALPLVNEALRDMADEISINDVQVVPGDQSVMVVIVYHVADLDVGTISDQQQLVLSFPSTGEGF